VTYTLHGCNIMLQVRFTVTYFLNDCNSISQIYCEFESRSGQSVQHYVIKFVSDLWQVGGFLRVFRFPPSIKLTAMI